MRADNGGVQSTWTIRGLSHSGGLPHVYQTALGTAGTSSVTVEPSRHRFIDAVNTAGNGADVEVVVRAFYSVK